MESPFATSQLKPNSIQTLDPQLKENLEKIALTIRGLSMDAVQKADSGHPGLPMGNAELGAYLWGVFLRYNPKNPHWMNRDRFILSAGHGSMLLYSVLFLSGYELTLRDIEHFRQLHSKTPGHPESLETPGVETTTGPLGQGMGNAVGQALGMKILAEKFNTPSETLLNPKVVTLLGDGDIMEGVTNEVSSLAGHLKLNNLIAIYDSNKICLDGPISECLSENTHLRYEALGWEVLEIDGHNLEEIHHTLGPLREKQEKPTLIISHTIIGKGSPNKAGSSKVHGSALGVDEVKLTKKALGLPEEPFFVPQSVYDFFHKKLHQDQEQQNEWSKNFEAWAKDNPHLSALWKEMLEKTLPSDLEKALRGLEIKAPVAGRKASSDVIQFLGERLPYLYGPERVTGASAPIRQERGAIDEGRPRDKPHLVAAPC